MSITVFDNHADDDPGNILAGHLSTHAVTCRTPGCPRQGIATTVPLPGHASGRRKRREVVYCGGCQNRITWSEIRALSRE